MIATASRSVADMLSTDPIYLALEAARIGLGGCECADWHTLDLKLARGQHARAIELMEREGMAVPAAVHPSPLLPPTASAPADDLEQIDPGCTCCACLERRQAKVTYRSDRDLMVAIR